MSSNRADKKACSILLGARRYVATRLQIPVFQVSFGKETNAFEVFWNLFISDLAGAAKHITKSLFG
jgi:hypothetical protein